VATRPILESARRTLEPAKNLRRGSWILRARQSWELACGNKDHGDDHEDQTTGTRCRGC
jgi:hypothetical protein